MAICHSWKACKIWLGHTLEGEIWIENLSSPVLCSIILSCFPPAPIIRPTELEGTSHYKSRSATYNHTVACSRIMLSMFIWHDMHPSYPANREDTAYLDERASAFWGPSQLSAFWCTGLTTAHQHAKAPRTSLHLAVNVGHSYPPHGLIYLTIVPLMILVLTLFVIIYHRTLHSQKSKVSLYIPTA